MRRAGSLADRRLADRFLDYLRSESIAADVRDESQAGGGVEVWILDEDDVSRGRELLEQFAADPDAEPFASAVEDLRKQREAELASQTRAARQRAELKAKYSQPIWARLPATFLLITLCLMTAVATGFGKENTPLINAMKISAPADGDPAVLPEVARGELWRLISPALLHFGPQHFFVNMVGLFVLGSLVEDRRGTGLFLLLVVTLAITTSVAQFLWSGPNFGGISGVVTGLFGYALVKSWVQPELEMRIAPEWVFLLTIYFVLCLTMVDNIANAAHVSGLVIGGLVALSGAVGTSLRGQSETKPKPKTEAEAAQSPDSTETAEQPEK